MTDEEFLNKFNNKETFTADELNELVIKCDVNNVFRVANRLYKLKVVQCLSNNDLDECVYTIYRLKERNN